MIPIVRPNFPPLKNIIKHFEASHELGKYTNFGPAFEAVVERLNKLFRKQCLPVSNGTTAIQVAVQTEFPRGSRVLLPDFTHIGTLNAVISAGMRPILAPVDDTLWTLSPNFLEHHREDYDAFVVVSPFGYEVKTKLYDEISDRYGKPVVYDFAGGMPMGESTPHPVCWSLHATKNVPIGEGGIVAFSTTSAWARAKQISFFDTMPNRLAASPYGGNHKMEEWKCATLLAQLDRWTEIMDGVMEKTQLIHYYQRELAELCTPHHLHQNGYPSFCVLAGFSEAKRMEEEGPAYDVELKRYYPLLTKMLFLDKVKRLGVSSEKFSTCVALPANVDENEVSTVISTIKGIHNSGMM